MRSQVVYCRPAHLTGCDNGGDTDHAMLTQRRFCLTDSIAASVAAAGETWDEHEAAACLEAQLQSASILHTQQL